MLPKTYEDLYYFTQIIKTSIEDHLLSIEQGRAAWKKVVRESNLIELPPFSAKGGEK